MRLKLKKIQSILRSLADKHKAQILQRFFKTGPGEYGEGDIFLGLTVPEIRKLAKEYQSLTLREVLLLLSSAIHEERLLALLILILKYSNSNPVQKKQLYHFYLNNIRYINNWDLVDLSAPNIMGAFLTDKDRKPLYALARSQNLWQRRIAVLSTFAFIRNNDYGDSIAIAQILLGDREDLIHKAVGWMLREIGKRNLFTEEKFLKKYYKRMPRTMLRYAIERFSKKKRETYLKRGLVRSYFSGKEL